MFTVLIAILVKQCLANYLLHKGGSLTERCRDRQRKFDTFEEWRFDLLLRTPMVMLLIALSLLICGVCRRMYLYLPVPYAFIPAVLGVLIYLKLVGTVMSL